MSLKFIELKQASYKNDEDVKFCMDIRNNPANDKHFFSSKRITIKMQKDFLKRENFFYIILYKNKKAGTISFHNVAYKDAEFGRFFVLEEYRKSGVALFALLKMINKGFKEFGFSLIYWKLVKTNVEMKGLLNTIGLDVCRIETDYIKYTLINGLLPKKLQKLFERFVRR